MVALGPRFTTCPCGAPLKSQLRAGAESTEFQHGDDEPLITTARDLRGLAPAGIAARLRDYLHACHEAAGLPDDPEVDAWIARLG